MRRDDFDLAWQINHHALAGKDPRTRDDPTLPYHLRWVWDGTKIDGRDVLVRCYHGLGDTIQFARFLPLLRTRARSVTLELQPRLVPLLARAGLADRIVPFDVARPLPPSDCDIEIMELGFALRADPARLTEPQFRIDPAQLPRGTVGLCCQAGDWDGARAIPPGELAALCERRTCITLDAAPSPLAVLNPQGCPFDLMATAELVAGASLVITVDTMIAHLAGALHRPTWLLLKHEPDWRWPSRGTRSTWYPTMRLYHQPRPGDWASVARRVLEDLETAEVEQAA